MRANPIITNFTSGEISPRLLGRVDVTKYFNGCQELENFIVMPHGGIDRRPGTYFVSTTKTSGKKVRLVPFEFSTTQAYILEFGENYIRVYKDRGQVSNTYAAWTTSTSYVLGDLVTNGGNYYRCIVAHSSGTFATDLSNGKWAATAGASDTAYEIPTTYTEAELFELQFSQSADTLYIAHPSHAPAQLTRSGHTSWTLSNISFTAASRAVITGATKANPCVITAADHGFVDGNVVYISDVAGMTELNGNYYTVAGKTANTFQLSGIDSTGYGTYTSGGKATRAITGATQANPCVITSVGHGFADGDMVYMTGVGGMTELNGNYYIVAGKTEDTFQLSGCNSTGYGAFTSNGRAERAVFGKADHYPSCVAFFEQRLCWAATNNKPQTIWMSASGDYTDYAIGTEDDSALEYTIASDRVNRIRWMVPTNFLFLGTVGGEFRFGGASANDPITPTSVNGKRQTAYGSKNVQAVLVGESVIYLQRSGRKMRAMSYNWETDSFGSRDITLLAEHITRTDDPTDTGITCIAHQQDPDSIIWGVREDGTLLGVTYEPEQQVVGWHRHTVTGGTFESVATIPGTAEDEVWVVILKGSTRYVSYMKPRDFGDQRDAFFVDLGITFDGGAAKDVTGATQADPVVVTAVAHGFSNGDKVRFQDVEGMTELNGSVYTVANKTDDTFELSGTDGTAFTAYTTGGEVEKVANSFSGATHLASLTVQGYGDGGDVGDLTVDGSGVIATTSYYNTLHVGLGYSSIVLPMPFEAGATMGTSQGETQRVHRLGVKVHNSLPFKHGPSIDDLKSIPFEINSELYTGDLSIEFDGDYGFPGDVYIVQDLTNPTTILALMPKLETIE